ncbi:MULTISPECIES: hypothetical protein [unclassified Arthrobacter]|uniref:hypothetical protein n=1 Tax=unclassified Arthrobacter TaxID=235627 RepID=UPI0033968CE3
MAGTRTAGGLMATAAALTLPLLLGSCNPGSVPFAGGSIPAGATAVEPTESAAAVLVPAPQPQAPPPPLTTPVEAEAAAPPPQQSAVPSAYGSTPDAGGSTARVPGSLSGAAQPRPSPSPEASAAPPGRPSAGRPAGPPSQQTGARPVTAYYVLLDDGGAGGVRFGCNDSLASVRRSERGSADPLAAAMNALLDGSAEPAPGLHNALASSTLTFLSGTFDGTTVTVYLAGKLRPGGVCDIPRVEAQLTQTAVASVGAIRAEVYVNGVGLAKTLSLR